MTHASPRRPTSRELIFTGICAGKASIATYLVQRYGFQQLTLQLPDPLDKTEHAIRFTNLDELVDFVTRRWQQRWVLAHIYDVHVLEVLRWKPFFLLISVDAPVSLRWERLKTRCKSHGTSPPTLEEFVVQSDSQLFAPNAGLETVMHKAQLRLLNSTTSEETLRASLDALDIPNPERLRPSWDLYFMELASLAAQRSNCMKRRVGCVIVREKRVISTGYNGTPRGIQNCNEGGCPRCNGGGGGGAGLETCLCIHAEENALIEAGRERIREGSILYCDTCPCLTCSIKIAQVGVSEVVYHRGYHMDANTAAVFSQAGVKLRQFSPPRDGPVELGALPTT